MADAYVIPFGTTLEDLEGGSSIRTDIANTAWDAILHSVAAEFAATGGSTGADWADPQAFYDLYNKSAPSNEEMSLYNAMMQSYYYLVGSETSEPYVTSPGALVAGNKDYDVMSPEDFQAKFTRKAGTNKNKAFEDYVNAEATKWAGHVNALLAGVGASGEAGGSDPSWRDSKNLSEQLSEKDKYLKAQQTAEAMAAAHLYEMPPLPGRSSAAVAEFKEQCFMLAHIFKFADYKIKNVEAVEIKRLPYQPVKGDSKPTNACLMAQAEPYAFMNKLTQYSTQSTLLNLSNSEISSLVPKIRLFKVTENDEGDETSQEFNFKAFHDSVGLDFLLMDKKKRGSGVGIKDFSFSYEGSNPFSVKKSIKASIELFASSFDELFRVRTDSALNEPYRYVDLALKTGGKGLKNKLNAAKGSLEYQNLENLNFRIKAVVGWQKPPGPDTTGIGAAVNNSFVTLNLTPTIHKFDIQDDGSVRFTCQYLAYIESHFDSQMFNVFGTEKVFKRQIERKLTLATLNQNCEASKLKGVKERYKSQTKEDINDAASSIMQRMLDREVIRYVNIPFSQLSALNKEGPYSPFGKKFNARDTSPAGASIKAIKEASTTAKELTATQKAAVLNIGNFSTRPRRGSSNNMYSCAFFYVSDLVDVILEGISERLENSEAILSEVESAGLKSGTIDKDLMAAEKKAYQKQKNTFRKMRVLLGPVEIVNQTDPSQSKFLNMGDLPVSVKYFIEWLSKYTINKASVDFPLPQFLNTFFKDFLNTFLNDDTCFEGRVRQRTTLSQAAITSYKRNPSDASDTISTSILMARSAAKTQRISRLDLDNMWKAGIAQYPQDPWPVLNLSGVHHEPISDTGAENEMNYLTYYAGRSHPVEKQNGDYAEDKDIGIHHYAVGKDRGIVKNIRMTATDIPYLKELRFSKEGYDGLEQLREVYDVNIDCYANVNTFPGTYIYVDPRGWSPTSMHVKKTLMDKLKTENPAAYTALKTQDLTKFGIGGYYMIKRSEHSFGPGKANTTIQAQWVAHPESPETKESAQELNKPSKQKCVIPDISSAGPATTSGASSGEWNDDLGESAVEDGRANARNDYFEECMTDADPGATGENSWSQSLSSLSGQAVIWGATNAIL
jgi:hypothetical protein